MNKIFLAGPISGLSIEVAEREFGRYEYELISQGFAVYNPIRELKNAGLLDEEWHVILRFSLKHMMDDCKELHLLPGWQNSRGAKIEHELANSLQIPVHYMGSEDELPQINNELLAFNLAPSDANHLHQILGLSEGRYAELFDSLESAHDNFQTKEDVLSAISRFVRTPQELVAISAIYLFQTFQPDGDFGELSN